MEYLIISAFGFLIYIIVMRIAFRIDTQVKNQEAMIIALTKIWERSGADPKEMEAFRKRYRVK